MLDINLSHLNPNGGVIFFHFKKKMFNTIFSIDFYTNPNYACHVQFRTPDEILPLSGSQDTQRATSTPSRMGFRFSATRFIANQEQGLGFRVLISKTLNPKPLTLTPER